LLVTSEHKELQTWPEKQFFDRNIVKIMKHYSILGDEFWISAPSWSMLKRKLQAKTRWSG
jgi:hypothetical protein